MKIRLNSSKGIVGVDIVIALSIMLLLAITIAAIYVNTNKNAISIQKSAQVSEMITNILEKIDLMYYDSVKTTENEPDGYVNLSKTNDLDYKELKDLISQKQDDVFLKVEEFTPNSAQNSSIDILKKITIKVSFKVNNKQEEIVMERLKYRELLVVPNKPVTTIDITPIKKNSNGGWVLASESDADWYNYDNNNYAYAVRTEDVEFDAMGNMRFLNAQTEAQVTSMEYNNIYIWVPAFGLNNENECRYIYGQIKEGANNEYADKVRRNDFTYYTLNSEKISCIKIAGENPRDIGFEVGKYGMWLNGHDFDTYANGTTSYKEYLQICK